MTDKEIQIYRAIRQIPNVQLRHEPLSGNIQIKFTKKTKENIWLLVLIQNKALSKFVHEKARSEITKIHLNWNFISISFSFTWSNTVDGQAYWSNINAKISKEKEKLIEKLKTDT